MTVKEVLCEAAKMLGETDVVNYLYDKVPENIDYCEETIAELKRCYNIITDEIACEYIPLETSEKFVVEGGKIEYSTFAKKPIRIKNVCGENGQKLPYKLFIGYLEVRADVVIVDYEYKPEEQSADDEAFYGNGIIGEYVLAYGIASEYCIAKGRIADAEVWDSKYINALRARVAEKRQLNIKARKWC